MVADRLTELLGVETDRGRRAVIVRVMTSESSGQVFQVQELHLIRANGDWEFVDSVDSTQAIFWLIGED